MFYKYEIRNNGTEDILYLYLDIKNEFSIKKLTEENSGLKEKISNLQNELNLLKINNQNNLSLLSEQKKEFDNKVQIYEEKIKNYIKENETMKQKIDRKSTRLNSSH